MLAPKLSSKAMQQPAGVAQVHVQVHSGSLLLERIAYHISVEFRDVSASVPNLLAPHEGLWARLASRFRRVEALEDKGHKQVLFGVSGSVRPGEVLALMGPSGSGKTTLLSILGGRPQKAMRVQGLVSFNGQPLTKRLKRRVGYVMQDDLLYESLTVHETLLYAALLRLPGHMSEAEKAGRVEDVIRALGLELCRDTIIGGFFRKGISGGERKRTSVGHELLINPSLIFLDEPTSGLDSTTAMHLLGVLRQLAAGGRAVVTTIHQPSSRLYQQLDKLLLISQGHAMYYGRASLAPDFFGSVGYVMPYGTNAADFLLDLASGDIAAGGRDGEASRQYLVGVGEAYIRSNMVDGFLGGQEGEEASTRPEEVDEPLPPATPSARSVAARQLATSPQQVESMWGAEPEVGVGVEEGQPPSTPAALPNSGSGQWREGRGSRVGSSSTMSQESSEGGVEDRRWGAPFHMQVAYLFRRSLRTRRFETLSKQDITQYLIIGVLSGLFWLQKAGNETLAAARNTVGLLFFLMMFLSIRALFVALFTFPEEHKMMLKERASGMYRLSAFYLARMLSDVPMDLAVPTGFFIIVYFMTGLRVNAGAFFGIYGTCILAMFVAQGIGLLLGALVMNPKTAQAMASVVMLTMVLTAGFFVVDIPAWIAWLKWLSYLYYAMGLLMYIEFDGGARTIYRCMEVTPGEDQCALTNPSSPETRPECSPVTSLKTSLNLDQDPSSSGDAVRDGMVLLGFMVFFRLVVYWALRKKTRGW